MPHILHCKLGLMHVMINKLVKYGKRPSIKLWMHAGDYSDKRSRRAAKANSCMKF